jgi:hypothetical protein
MTSFLRLLHFHIGIISTVGLLPMSSLAQSIPVLRTEWKGIATVTAVGAPTPIHPHNKANVAPGDAVTSWNAYQEVRSLQVIKQQGRHMELALISPRGYRRLMLGTLSVDGKQLQVVDATRDFLLSIDGDKMSGCGSVRGDDGSFEYFRNNYASICWDFTSVK